MSIEEFVPEYLDAFDRLFLEGRNIDGDFKYVDRINRMIRDGQFSLVIDYPDLILMDNLTEADLSNKIIDEPAVVVANGNEALRLFVERENPEYFRTNRKEKFFVRFRNLPNGIKIRDIRSKDVDDIFELEGIIIRTTEIKSILEYAEFQCENGHMLRLELTWGQYQTPTRCSDFDCDSKKFNPLPTNKDDMIDWQFITLQEKPEDLPPGSSPKAIPCRLVYDLVNAVRPGDRVTLTGVIRSRETKLKKRGQVLTFDNWVDVNYVQSISKEDELTKITPAEEQEFLDMAEDPQIFDHLVDSLAPQIHKMDRIKQAALLMLFAGVDKSHPDGFSTRGQPNILLVGDPGVAKSQLLRYVQSIAPRGLYTSGKGSSAAGLTAAIIRDPETGEITLEAGAMVLADRGVCLIDEFDKMNENDRSAIHEAMEQHTVSVAKAGIVATLNARTGVLAAANPKHGRYEDYRPFNENVNLSPAILSRFDLVFIMRDIPEEKDDEQLASHILKLHRFHGSSDSRRPPLNEEKLRKYIAFAKKQFNPIITEPAAEKIQHYYVNMRNSYGAVGENPKDRITITARQLEGIIRLAESHARARLKENVTEEDADFAIDLMKYSLDQITLDPESGEYDYDAFISGQTKTRRSKLNMVRDAINFMHKDAGGSFNEEETIQFAIKESGDTLTDEYVRGAIEQMIRDGQLYRPNRGKLDKP